MRMILDKPDTSLPDALKQTNLRTVFHLLSKAWDDVTATAIENCWTHALGEAFTTPLHDAADDDNDDFLGFSQDDVTEAERRLREVMDQQHLTFSSVMADWAMADMDEPITATATMDDIIADATDATDEEDDVVTTDALPTLPATDCHAPSVAQDIPTAQQAVWHMEQALHFLENCPDVDELEVFQMKALISKTKGRLRRKQARLTDYFTPPNVSD